MLPSAPICHDAILLIGFLDAAVDGFHGWLVEEEGAPKLVLRRSTVIGAPAACKL
ncbi:hypothetical protein ACLOJK_034820 [Asimina triloba]